MVTKNNKGKTVQGGKNRGDKTPAVVTPSVSGGAAAVKADTATPKKPFNPFRFFKEVRIEGGRITWPSRKETWITTVMVLIMVFLACLFFSLTDAIFSFGLENLVRLTRLGKAAHMAQQALDAVLASNPNHKWYIVHAYSNFEKKVAEALRDQAKAQGLEDKFSEILVPTEEIVEIRRNRKVNSERKFFPGYVLVKMEMTDQAYHLVKNTPKVTGFLGSGSKPIPVSEREVQRIVGNVDRAAEKPKTVLSFDIGEKVKVIDGPFASFDGVVESVDQEKARLRVSVSIFGRATPVELEYAQVEKTAG